MNMGVLLVVCLKPPFRILEPFDLFWLDPIVSVIFFVIGTVCVCIEEIEGESGM